MPIAPKRYTDETQRQRAAMGVWLRSLREEAGLSQRELADKLGFDYYTFISQLENGRGRIPPVRYRDWALALGLEPREFVVTLLSHVEPTTHAILFGEAG